MINSFIKWENKSSLIQLIDAYTPLLKRMVKKPFAGLKISRLIGMQKKIDFYIEEKSLGYWYIASRSKDIIQEALLGFIKLVYSFDSSISTFSGYIKNYLPFELENLYKEILGNIESIYIDSLEEGDREEYMLKFLSCTIEEEEELDLDKYRLTEQQLIVATIISEGLNISQTAKELGISRAAVKKHLNLIGKKIKKVS